MHILEPLTANELREIFTEKALKVIDYMIKKAIFSQPERMSGQAKLPIQIPKEHIEQWLAQALKARSIGAGSYPVDLIDENGVWGADIKMLSASVDSRGVLTNNDSGETSLGQNFKGAGKMLDHYFVNGEYSNIKDLWMQLIKEKLAIPVRDFGIQKIYYFILVRGGNYLYLLGLNVSTERYDNVTVNVHRTSESSVFLDNYIDSSLGSVKIYKAKKRMELRLHPKNWFDRGYMIPFEIALDSEQINFTDYLDGGNDILEYGKQKATRIFD